MSALNKASSVIWLLANICAIRFGIKPRVARELTHGSDPVDFPLKNSELHMGFVNSERNAFGLQARFFVGERGTAHCRWMNSQPHFQGFPGIIHGGVLMALGDELMANCVVANCGKFAMSLKVSARWFRPTRVSDAVIGHSSIRARIGPFMLVRGTLYDESNRAICRMEGVYYIPTVSQFERVIGRPLMPELIPFVRRG